MSKVMIQEFSIENYRSIKEKQTISFVATSDKILADDLIIEPKQGVRLLRMSLIYGPNASGKSNVLLAIQAVWLMLFSPNFKDNEKTPVYQPFELLKGFPTKYDIVFWANGKRFEYKLENDENSILYEKMEYTTDSNVLSLMYERKKGENIKFGSTIDIKAKQRDELNRETLVNHTVLSTLNKKNIDVPSAMRELYEWIKNHVHELDIYNNVNEIAEQAINNPKMKNLILELLNKADLDVVDFQLIDIEVPESTLDKALNNIELNDLIKIRLMQPRKQLLFTHKNRTNKFIISFNNESTGTQTYFRLSRILFDLRDSECVVMDDELDKNLHYDLLIHYLQTFLQTKNNSQLIFTTHNLMLLNEDWMIRRDMVWFTEKNKENSATVLSRASDMGLHKNVSLMNAYRIGKLGAKPLLGSTFLSEI